MIQLGDCPLTARSIRWPAAWVAVRRRFIYARYPPTWSVAGTKLSHRLYQLAEAGQPLCPRPAAHRPPDADHAALRRDLIDEGLLSREAGVYWRTGGYVDV
ncbi:DUF2087 domain-containing protein [Geodermatophilus sp. URMC 64]